MPYITPEGVLQLFKGIEIDKNYQHSIYFATINDQNDYFGSNERSRIEITSMSYTREEKNTIKVAQPAKKLYGYNYMRFQNATTGTPTRSAKWFYAFINNVEYVNDNTTKITYTIDVLQTWLFDFKFGDSFIEREHALTDVPGDNTIDEGIDYGEYIFNYQNKNLMFPVSTVTDFKGWRISVRYIPNRDPDKGVGKRILNVFIAPGGGWTYTSEELISATGVHYDGDILAPFLEYTFDLEDATEGDVLITAEKLQATIDAIVETNGTPVQVCYIPKVFYYNGVPQITFNAPNGFKQSYPYATQAGYIPKNKKLLCYPYNFVRVYNLCGSSKDFRYEDFTLRDTQSPTDACSATFRLKSSILMNPQCELYPYNYRNGGYNATDASTTDSLIISKFPEVPFSVDSFAQWWATNKTAFALSMITNVLSTTASIGVTAATGGALAAAAPASAAAIGARTSASIASQGVSGASGIVGLIGQYITEKRKPDQLAGQANGDWLTLKLGRVGYLVTAVQIKAEYAKIIDEYFTMYGYKCNQVKKPNIVVGVTGKRNTWTYTKTKGCIIHAASTIGIPADVEETLASIFDNGITFWKSAAEVGNYSQDNSILYQKMRSDYGEK